MESDTLSLRKAAPNWSLAGDKQLLGILEKIHETIVSKCQDANTKLDAMVAVLDNASVDLQNVNNKFMALSNSQFVESRVYDDDGDVAPENVPKNEQEIVQPTDNEVDKIKMALQKLEMMHEPVQILNSDSSDDEETSVILKPKDLYSHRPLPYIIGSAAWRSKWHAGLIKEDSDSDSSVSKQEEGEEYSESETEAIDVQTDKLQRTISSSSSIQSEPQIVQQKPADVAAEIARRFASQPVKVPEPRTEPASTEEPKPTKTVYRMEKPLPATIFPNEPPPLDNMDSGSSEEDIFEELHRKPHQNKSSSYRPDIMKDLFGDNITANIVSEETKSSLDENSTKLDDKVGPKLIDEKIYKDIPEESNSKKPVGGISLFGSTKGAESIGAAILKRNERKSSTSEESDVAGEKHKNSEPTDIKHDSKKLIEDLFVKPVKKNENIKVKLPYVKPSDNKEPENPKHIQKPAEKIDLFSDNLFDDIDDIFTSNVVTKPKTEKNTKSIFDDDDDDLFTEITETPQKSNKKDTKSIFDDDNDLFAENDKNEVSAKVTETKTSLNKNIKVKEEIKKVKSIFDDDSDDDLFSDVQINTSGPRTVDDLLKEPSKSSNTSKIITDSDSEKKVKVNNDNELIKDDLKVTAKVNIISEQVQSPNLFDDEDDELFNTTKAEIEEIRNELQKSDNNKVTSHIIKTDVDNLISNEPDIPPHITSNEESKVNEFTENVSEHESTTASIETVVTDNSQSYRAETVEQIEKGNTEEVENMLQGEISKYESSTDQEKPEQKSVLIESKEPDFFSDIFADLPPAFEKPSEPKKSKNVNALFDDDSDDESLFFKKDDVITDEKPDVNLDSDRFRIFHDEPPDIDVDFAQKPLKISSEPKKVLKNDTDHFEDNHNKPVEYVLPQNLDVSTSKHDKIEKLNSPDETLEETEHKTKIDISKLLDVKDVDENIIHGLPQEKPDRDENEVTLKDEIKDSEEYETKKPIGKLKPMNFNINVNTLLPGASPKKSKLIEETDGQNICTQINEVLNVQTKDVTAKSVSFDGDSEILNNKLSKERAKIQVKRRPSSRRARLEAVRKSRIDLESDSTDNSSSFDEPKQSVPEDLEKSKIDSNLNVEPNSLTKTETNTKEETTIAQNIEKKTEVTSKVVYILNDEDIFSTTNSAVEEGKQNKTALNIVDDDNELFKTSSSSQNQIISKQIDIKKVETLDTYTNIKPMNKDKKSLFGDSDDEELFGKKKICNVKTTSIFDSDSEEDAKLFTSKKRMEKTVIRKGPLFGDSDDDDEDLFGDKTKPSDIQTQISKREKIKKSTEPAFEHPLAFVGDDR